MPVYRGSVWESETNPSTLLVFNTSASQVRGEKKKNLFHHDFISFSLMNIKQTQPVNGLFLALPLYVYKHTHTQIHTNK